MSPEEQQKTGASMWISEIPRIPPESVDPSVKNYHWLDLDMALFDAYDHGARNGGAARPQRRSPKDPATTSSPSSTDAGSHPRGTLMGVTRRTLLDLCDESSNPAEEGRLTADELLRADEVLTCTTAGGVMPVTTLNGKPIGDGSVGLRTGSPRPVLATALRSGLVDGRALQSTNQLASS